MSFLKRFWIILTALALLIQVTCMPVLCTDEVLATDPVETLETAGYEVQTVSDSGVAVASASAGTVLISSATGGTVAVAGHLLPVLGYIVGMGVTCYSIYKLAQLTTELASLLTEATILVLTEWYNAGALDTFAFDDSLAADFEDAFNQKFFSDDGSFATLVDLSFDASELLTYTSDGRGYSDDLHDIFEYEISFNGPTSIGNTGITARLVMAPESLSGDYALQVTNTGTGVSTTYAINSSDIFEDGATKWYLSRPMIKSDVCDNGTIFYTVAWQICRYAAESAYAYFGATVSDDDSFIIEGVPDFALNGVACALVSTLAAGSRLWVPTAVDTTLDSEDDVVTPGMRTLGRNISLDQDDDYAIPYAPSDVLYLPNDLDDVDTYTPSVARTGNPAAEEAPDTSTTAGWSTLWDWLQRLLDGILSIPGLIIDGIEIVLKSLFVPDLTEVQDLVDVYSNKFFWVSDVTHFMSRLFESLSCDDPPKIPINLGAAESKYDWGTDGYILDMSWYARYKPSVDTILSGILWTFFLWNLFKRIPDIMAGAGMLEVYSTLEPGWVFKERQNRRS